MNLPLFFLFFLVVSSLQLATPTSTAPNFIYNFSILKNKLRHMHVHTIVETKTVCLQLIVNCPTISTKSNNIKPVTIFWENEKKPVKAPPPQCSRSISKVIYSTLKLSIYRVNYVIH